MKTLKIIVISLWIFFFTAVVVAVVNKWDNIWIALPIIGVVVLGVLYSEIYKENRPPKTPKIPRKLRKIMREAESEEDYEERKKFIEDNIEWLMNVDFRLMNHEKKN